MSTFEKVNVNGAAGCVIIIVATAAHDPAIPFAS
jgi:hypothetical protein